MCPVEAKAVQEKTPAPDLVIDDAAELIDGFDRELLAGPSSGSKQNEVINCER